MSITDKAKELSEQAAEKFGDLGGDELIANTIIRAAEKKDWVNQVLEEKECEYRISTIEVENSVPPKVVFSVSRESE